MAQAGNRDAFFVEDRQSPKDRVMLVAADPDGDHAQHAPLAKLRVLGMIGRRSLPSIIEATVIPTALFYAFFAMAGPGPAMLASLAWSYGSTLRRVISGQRVPGLLQLATAGLTVRTIVGLVSGTFMYFLQPIATTLVVALVFLISLWCGRPMVARLASDFCPVTPEIASRPGVVRLFSGLTLLWAGVHFLSAGTTFAMLMSLPTTTFVVVRSIGSLVITIGAIAFTVSWAMRTARTENLILAPVAR